MAHDTTRGGDAALASAGVLGFWSSYQRRRRVLGYVYIAPVVLAVALVIGYPLVYNATLSLSRFILRTGAMRFVGLENYEAVLSASHFYDVVRQTFIWSAGSVSLQITIGLAVALMLNSIKRGRGLLAGVVLIPWVSSFVVSAAIWRWLLHPEIGALAEPFRAVGLGIIIDSWRSDPVVAMLVMILVNTWKYFPFVTVMILAALQTIEADLYEAAMIDGANAIQRFRHVTVPGLRLQLLGTVILTTTWALNAFTLMWLMTGGAPAGSTDLITMLIYRTGFLSFKFGEAAATSILLFVIVLSVTLVYVRLFGREGME